MGLYLAICQVYRKFWSLRLHYRLIIIGLVTLLIFLWSKGPSPGQNHFVYLADAFLHGKLGLSGNGVYLAELVPFNGNYYVVYPPMPALLLLPLVSILSTTIDQALFSVILASICVSITYLMLHKSGASSQKIVWLTILFGFGTCFWFIASVGSSWYIEHVVAVLFLTSAIIMSLYRRSNFLIGFLLGCATLARLPVILSFPFFLLTIYEQQSSLKPRLKQIVYFFVGLAILVALNALYNYARYGVFNDLGYYLIPGINEDPYFTEGIFSVSYIPRHIYAILFQGPIYVDYFPYFKPSWMGLGLFLTTPAFIYAFKSPWNSLSKKAVLAILCILPPLLTHGTVGFTQFGYRFSLDFTPFLLILTANGMGDNVGWQAKALIVSSVLINLWGVISIIKFDFVSF